MVVKIGSRAFYTCNEFRPIVEYGYKQMGRKTGSSVRRRRSYLPCFRDLVFLDFR